MRECRSIDGIVATLTFSGARRAPPFRSLYTIIAVCSLVALALTSSTAMAEDAKTLFATCIACHGGKGEGNANLNAPAIAGQDAKYLERQLHHFRTGRRGTHKADAPGAQMRAAAMVLKDNAAVSALADYIARLPGTTVAAPARGDLRSGNNLYQGKCGACHGGRAEGNAELNSPRLAGLDTAYIKRQFAYFRDGVRGTHAQDTPGRQMALMAKTLANDRELDDVIAFIHQQGRPQ